MNAPNAGQFHPLLLRQLRHIDQDDSAFSLESLAPFLRRVNNTYAESDQHRLLLERTFELSVGEERNRFQRAQHLNELRLAWEQDRFETVLEAVAAAVLIADHEGRITAVNPDAIRLLGPRETLVGTHLREILRTREATGESTLLVDVDTIHAASPTPRWEFTNVQLSPMGAAPFVADCVVLAYRSAQAHAGFVVFIADHTAREQSLAELQWQATHDPLTGLSNRTMLLDRLQRALASARRSSIWPALLFIDLDRFKSINDHHGHAGGDSLLVETARRIEQAVRPADTVARLGGDEFVVLCESVEHAGIAQYVAERILHSMSAPFELGEQMVTLSASIGIVHPHGIDDTATDVLRDADLAMYRAKENGRNRIEVFNADTQHEDQRRVAIERALRAAIDNGELSVLYQPIFALATGQPVAFEALARWHDQELGVVDSTEFLALAEETGLIVPLGLQLLNRAFVDTRKWQAVAHRELRLHLNISARQFSGNQLLTGLESALQAMNLSTGLLTLEIPEAVFVHASERTIERLRALRESGIRIALNSYGAHGMALGSLGQLPIDMIKLDPALIRQVTDSTQGSATVQAVIELAAPLNIAVVAQGIERAEEFRVLRSLGCQFGQGFLLAVPMAASGALAMATCWSMPTTALSQPPHRR